MKPTYRQSQIVNYFTCPKKFGLSMVESLTRSRAMEDGLLFESLVFGVSKDDSELATHRKRQATTFDVIKEAADITKKYFGKGEPFYKMELPGSRYNLQGEADFIGKVLFGQEYIRCIADLKYAGDLDKIWRYKDKKHDFLQAVMYPYLFLKLTGELLPFVYYVVEAKHELGTAPLIRQIMVEPTEQDFVWLESVIETVHDDIFRSPNAEACIVRGIRCPFLEKCGTGRDLLAPIQKIKFSDLG